MKTRTDLINFFIKTFNYETYLEIGLAKGNNFINVKCPNKEAIDPNTTYFSRCYDYGILYEITSDKFFESIDAGKKWDLIFVDGLHEKKQVKKDIENSLLHLNENGTIVCHDVNPREELLLAKNLCWNAWEVFAELRCTRPDLEIHGVQFDHTGFIRLGKQNLFEISKLEYNWQFLNSNRQELMQELTNEQLISKYT